VAATVNNRRYYGALFQQEALKTASTLYIQNTAAELDTNRRMKTMLERKKLRSTNDTENAESKTKPTPHPEPTTSSSTIEDSRRGPPKRQVEKFRFVEGKNGEDSDYRLLLATYSDVEAAGEDDKDRTDAIAAACQSGGDFVGNYYYQFQSNPSSLEVEETKHTSGRTTRGLRMSMGFNTFLQNTALPEWFPLSHLELGRQQVLDTLGMKKDGKGSLVWDQSARGDLMTKPKIEEEPLLPIESRSRYRVVVVGGGIAGLSCCLELFQVCERDGIDIEITLVEGRSRLGGRLWTDRSTFKSKKSTATASVEENFPVDLGASWIHGIESNPLAAMAEEARVDFVRTSEEVTMLREKGEIIDHTRDERAGELFDRLLDIAVQRCWRREEASQDGSGGRPAVRWYAKDLKSPTHNSESISYVEPQRMRTGAHRDSADTSVDEAIGKVVSTEQMKEIAAISEEERRMLKWNVKNVEYALGANITDLSMKYWDIDERHAFEGDHVVLRQGYSCVVEHMLAKLRERGGRFTCLLGSPVKRIEYGRKTLTNPYFCPSQRHKHFVELSETCRVECDNGTTISGDFAVCAVPLGVLKDSIRQGGDDQSSGLQFSPELPFSKTDSIESVGFGLLDKVYVQFPTAFWRTKRVFNKYGQTLFGNASATNPEHYMFLDVGLSLGKEGCFPPVLMVLISGTEAVQAECLSEKELVESVLKTLKTLFGDQIPEPSAFKVTRWGRDRFSRGSYTYLPPGTTDQDLRLLQTPINSNGDSVLLDASETMRLFFAGEHTTTLHPSMAHGAMLSGFRAAKEIASSLVVSSKHIVTDSIIPLSLFRQMNPKAKLTCAFCHLTGQRVREGTLLAFKKGSRQVLSHLSCAETCPEVAIKDGVWSNVISACNRAKSVPCSLCGQIGAAVTCASEMCGRSYHFGCAEDTGWRFENEGKDFYCDEHRYLIEENRKISVEYWLLNAAAGTELACALCGKSNVMEVGQLELGQLLAFQQGARRVLVHEGCLRYTTVAPVAEVASSRFEKDFDNVFGAIDSARTCSRCARAGATIGCAEPGCENCVHFRCARALDWDFKKNRRYRCIPHRESNDGKSIADTFQHALFSPLAAEPTKDVPANLDVGTDLQMPEEDKALSSQAETFRNEKLNEYQGEPVDFRLVSLTRGSIAERWNLKLNAAIDQSTGCRLLSVAGEGAHLEADLHQGDIICTINGMTVGSPALDTIEKVLKILSQEVDLLMEVCSGVDDVWR